MNCEDILFYMDITIVALILMYLLCIFSLLLIGHFTNKEKLIMDYDDPKLRAGEKIISATCEDLIKQGVNPIVVHILEVDRKNDRISFETIYEGEITSKRTVGIQEFQRFIE